MAYRESRGDSSFKSEYDYKSNSDDPDNENKLNVETLLKGDLGKAIVQIVKQQAAHTFQKLVSGDNEAESENIDAKTVTDNIEPFDPDDKYADIDKWLNKIEQFSIMQGLSSYEMTCYMHAKLRGGARRWFNGMAEHSLSWDDWKTNLRLAFPPQYDFACLLDQMLSRHKDEDETMSHYYRDKLTMCERCDIEGKKAVSCIIRGLPENMRRHAYTLQCETPEALYYKFLLKLENYKPPISTERRMMDYDKVRFVERSPERTMREYDINNTRRANDSSNVHVKRLKQTKCYNCQRYTTHISKDCPERRMERCRLCRQAGHIFANCPNRPIDRK